jgi:putative transposase
MSRYRRAFGGSCYFFTVVTYRRRAILCDDAVRLALRDAINTVRASRPFFIDAWVLLPDHLHCVWTLPEGDVDFSTRWIMIKRLVTVACRDSYHRADLMNESKFKHRLVTQVRDWPHSTFHRYADAGIYPLNWCGDATANHT